MTEPIFRFVHGFYYDRLANFFCRILPSFLILCHNTAGRAFIGTVELERVRYT